MIKFFRRFRRQFLFENKFSKYLIYAIGEIILVVLGILIALWISEWNKKQHQRTDEIIKLKQIKTALEHDFKIVNNEIKVVSIELKQVKILDSLIKAKAIPISIEMDSLFGSVYGMRQLDLNTALYDDLKANGFDLIQNDSIRVQLIKTFET